MDGWRSATARWSRVLFGFRLLDSLKHISLCLLLFGMQAAKASDADRGRTPNYIAEAIAQGAIEAEGLYVLNMRLYPGVSIDAVRAHFGPDIERYRYDGKSIYYIWRIAPKEFLSGLFDDIGSLQSVTITGERSSYAVVANQAVKVTRQSIQQLRHLVPNGCLGEEWGGENLLLRSYYMRTGPEGSWAYEFSSSIEQSRPSPGMALMTTPVSSITLSFVDVVYRDKIPNTCPIF